ncbi:MAG: hypothetical protein IH986_01610 [Planctomycetes bacterium]|nr:hypothetical protein [Planctomycetota bacterium]
MKPEDRVQRRRNRIGALIAGAVFAALLPALGGCQGVIVGEWQMVQCTPNREVFCIDEAVFRRDGTYAATTTIEGRTTREIGTYKFNGFTLKLRPQTGGERSYGAVRHAASIEVTHDSNKVVLRKGRAKTDDEAP